MKAHINGDSLNKLMAGVKRFVKTTESKTQLNNYIQLEFSKSNCNVTATATDGHKLSIEHSLCNMVDEDFTAYVLPTLRKFKKDTAVFITLIEDDLFFDLGNESQGYRQPKTGVFLDCREVVRTLEQTEPIYRIGFDPKLLIEALQSAKESGHDFRNKIIMEFRGDKDHIIFKTGDNNVKLILPVRIF